MTPRVRTVFIGSGEFGVESLRHLKGAVDLPVELVGVVTAPPRPSGRRRRLTPTPIDAAAGELGVGTVLRPERLRSPDAISSVLALLPELVVLADYGQIVPQPLLDPQYGALNLHPSLLPRHRGASPIPATILAGDAETGVTLMKMDHGLDTGPIVAQIRRPLTGTETTPELEALLGGVDAPAVLRRALGPWIRGDTGPRRQPAEGATLTRPLRREDGRLDPHTPAAVLERQVRAYQPWPGSFVETSDGRLIVWRAAVADPGPAAAPGTLVQTSGGIGLATVEGTLDLLELQPAGGKRMPARDLVRGRVGLIGQRAVGPAAAPSGQ